MIIELESIMIQQMMQFYQMTIAGSLYHAPLEKQEDGDYLINLTITVFVSAMVNQLLQMIPTFEKEAGKNNLLKFIDDLENFLKNHPIAGQGFKVHPEASEC